MNTKQRLILFSVQFPIMLLVGMVLSFAYTMRFEEEARIDWVIALVSAIVVYAVVTYLNKRDQKRHHGVG